MVQKEARMSKLKNFVDWREFSQRDKIKRLPIYEQKRLYFLELQRQQHIMEIMQIQEQMTFEPAVQPGWVTSPARSGPGSAASAVGSPGYVTPTDDVNDYCVNDFISDYFELADPIH